MKGRANKNGVPTHVIYELNLYKYGSWPMHVCQEVQLNFSRVLKSWESILCYIAWISGRFFDFISVNVIEMIVNAIKNKQQQKGNNIRTKFEPSNAKRTWKQQ